MNEALAGPSRAGMAPDFLRGFAAADCLVYGIGNVARQDDGLGWAFVDWLEETGRCGAATLRRCYQLQLEDAELVARFRRVLFVDATKDPHVTDFAVLTPVPTHDVPFTSHALSVSTVLATARLCFDVAPDARILALRGYCWDLVMGLTDQAQSSLSAVTG